MLHNSRLILYITLGLTCVSALYSADDQHKAYRLTHSYRPTNPPILNTTPSQPIKRDYSIAEYLLKDEIRVCGIPAIRKRIQNAIVKTDRMRGQQDICFACNFLTINRTFYARSDDLLSHVVFNTIATKTTPDLDDCTSYRTIDDTMQVVELVASIHDQDFIEKTIANVQQNG